MWEGRWRLGRDGSWERIFCSHLRATRLSTCHVNSVPCGGGCGHGPEPCPQLEPDVGGCRVDFPCDEPLLAARPADHRGVAQPEVETQRIGGPGLGLRLHLDGLKRQVRPGSRALDGSGALDQGARNDRLGLPFAQEGVIGRQNNRREKFRSLTLSLGSTPGALLGRSRPDGRAETRSASTARQLRRTSAHTQGTLQLARPLEGHELEAVAVGGVWALHPDAHEAAPRWDASA